MIKDYYYMLGIPESCSASLIKDAYRKLSKRIHPDTNKNDKFFEDYFKQIQEAYATLSDESLRKTYNPYKYQTLGSQKEIEYKNEIASLRKLIDELRRSALNFEAERKKLVDANKNLAGKVDQLQLYADKAKGAEMILSGLNESLKRKSRAMKRYAMGMISSAILLTLAITYVFTLSYKLDDVQNELSLSQSQADATLVQAQNLEASAVELNTRTEHLRKELSMILDDRRKTYSNQRVSTVLPFYIDEIEFNNMSMLTDHLGIKNLFLAPFLRYVKPTLHISPRLNINDDLIMFVKIRSSDGTLFTNNDAKGYTYHQEISYNPSMSTIPLLGWGNEYENIYPPGEYTLEIWAFNTFIIETNFYVANL